MSKTPHPNAAWSEALSLALLGCPTPPSVPTPTPTTPEEVLEWLPALVRAVRKQAAQAASRRAAAQAKRGWVRGQGAKAVAGAVLALMGPGELEA